MRHRCTGALLLAAVLAAVGLAACGGGGSSASTPAAAVSSTASTPAPAVTATTPATTATATAPTATAKPAERAPRPSTTSTSNSSSSSGPAASFRTPGGDNSIPDYGNEAPPTERQRATAALAAFLRARANGEWSKACTYLAGTTRSQLERLAGASKGRVSGCGPILAALSKGPASTRADTLTAGVASLRIKGNSAFALYHGPKGSKYVMPLRNEGGAWKVSELAPIA
ncbi:MAG TPA: hypothetical protein VNY52_06625, partial [Solirubrobacteraceae bacterium]|nr:hypothetical protein [Solirubrobacteraceae bacterium]